MARSQKSSRALLRLLDGSAAPLFVLDEDRTIVFCNAALEAWLGVAAEELLGKRCDYHDGGVADPVQRLAARLCPPPEAFHGQGKTATITCETERGVRRRQAAFVPLASERGAACVLAVVEQEELAAPQPRDGADDEAAALHLRLIEWRRQFGLDRRLDRLAGESDAMRRVRQQVELAVRSRGHVLIVGPAGCGAEGIARAIHGGHAEPRGRLVPLACSLLDAELLQAGITDLKRPARHRQTEPSGTLLLLEADRLSPQAQDELAGFLMLPGFELETIATAEASLLRLAEEGRFRRDLAHALSTLVIELPPLADRRDDVPLLAQQLLEETNAGGGRQLAGFTPEALDVLAAYHWPGDVDELAEVIRAARGNAASPQIGVAELPERLHLAAQAAAYPPQAEETIDLDKLLAEIEAELIRRALARAKGNKSRAAELLGVTRARLHRRLVQSNGQPEAKVEAEGPIFDEIEADGDFDA
jgi:transcriptional regulator with PAS, ATPase and Fis domain